MMYKLISIFCFFSATGFIDTNKQAVFFKGSFANHVNPHPSAYSANTLIIFFNNEINHDELLRAVKNYQAELIYQYYYLQSIAIRIPAHKEITEAISYSGKIKGVVAVNRDQIITIH